MQIKCGSPPSSANSSNPDLTTGDSASKMFRTSAVANFACDEDNNMESLGAECESSGLTLYIC